MTFETVPEQTSQIPNREQVVPEKSHFYETVTEVNSNLRFSLLGMAFALLFGCDACCSPPCFYSHFM